MRRSWNGVNPHDTSAVGSAPAFVGAWSSTASSSFDRASAKRLTLRGGRLEDRGARRPRVEVDRPADARGHDLGELQAADELLDRVDEVFDQRDVAGRVAHLVLDAPHESGDVVADRARQQRRRIDRAGERAQLTRDRIDAIRQRRRRVGAVEQVADAVEHVGRGRSDRTERVHDGLDLRVGGSRVLRREIDGHLLQALEVLRERGHPVQRLRRERRELARVEPDGFQQVGQGHDTEQLGLDPGEEVGGIGRAVRGVVDVPADRPAHPGQTREREVRRDEAAGTIALPAEVELRRLRDLEEHLGVRVEAVLRVVVRVRDLRRRVVAGQRVHRRYDHLGRLQRGRPTRVVLRQRSVERREQPFPVQRLGLQRRVVGLRALRERDLLAAEIVADELVVRRDVRLVDLPERVRAGAGQVVVALDEQHRTAVLDHVALDVDREHLEEERRRVDFGEEHRATAERGVRAEPLQLVGLIEVRRDARDERDRLERHDEVEALAAVVVDSARPCRSGSARAR